MKRIKNESVLRGNPFDPNHQKAVEEDVAVDRHAFPRFLERSIEYRGASVTRLLLNKRRLPPSFVPEIPKIT